MDQIIEENGEKFLEITKTSKVKISEKQLKRDLVALEQSRSQIETKIKYLKDLKDKFKE